MPDPAVHVRSVGLDDTDDDVIFPWAERESHVVVTADADFGEMLALGVATYAFAPYRSSVESDARAAAS